nr:hypothetical protein [Abalone asfa-like virus]
MPALAMPVLRTRKVKKYKTLAVSTVVFAMHKIGGQELALYFDDPAINYYTVVGCKSPCLGKEDAYHNGPKFFIEECDERPDDFDVLASTRIDATVIHTLMVPEDYQCVYISGFSKVAGNPDYKPVDLINLRFRHTRV